MRALPGAMALLGLVAGCVRTQLHAEAPAVLAGDSASLAVLQSTLDRALGMTVTLAADALTRDSTLVIEPAALRSGGQRLDGRETRAPETFQLVRSGASCVLVRASTGVRLSLPGARCRALR